MHHEPYMDDYNDRALARHQAQADRDEMEFDRWLASRSDETRAVVAAFEKVGGVDVYSVFWVCREAGEL